MIKPIDQLPKGLKKVINGVLLLGESTGHAHRIVGGEAFEDAHKNMYLQVVGRAQIVHEEHKPINLKAGKYAVIRQREYVSTDMIKVVVD